MSFSDIVQSLKTGKRLFVRAGQGSVESLHHFPSHQLSQQKKFSLLRLRADPLNASPKEIER